MVRHVHRVPGYPEDALAGPLSFGGSSGRCGQGLMGKVPSLVFEMEDEDQAHQHPDGAEDGDATEVVQKLQALLEPWSEAEYMLLLHVRFAREEAAKRGHVNTLPDLADTLRRLGYLVKIRTALGGGGGGACLRNLRHSFLTVSIQGPSQEAVEYVVDPRFREQFEIAHQTRRYNRVLAALGPEVVATPDRINKVVELLCSELAGAFSEAKTPLPPWRQHAAMLSKWQPRRSEEVEVSAAILNNEVGLRPALDAIRGGRRKVAPVTGPATIAQRLAMLGVQQPSRVSPVAEGLEAGTDWSTSSLDESPGASSDIDAQDELEGDVAALEEEEEEEEDGAPGAAAGAAVGPAPLAKMLSDSVGPEAAQAACGAPAAGEQGDRKPSHIWQGIRKAVAALPQRRNTWA